jgi:hypothetical protein
LLTDTEKVRERRRSQIPPPFSSSSFSPFQWPEKATHKRDEKKTTTTTKTQPGTAASLKTRYEEKLMKPKREKSTHSKTKPRNKNKKRNKKTMITDYYYRQKEIESNLSRGEEEAAAEAERQGCT